MLIRPAVVLAMVTAMTMPLRADEVRGSVAFHYGRALTPAQLEFFGRFDVLVTHDPLPAAQVAELHRRGTKLALYEWSVAFYRTLAGAWDEQMLSKRGALLNRTPLYGGSGAPDADAYYYDPAWRGFASARSKALATKLRAVSYDGVFLDTTTEQSVHPDALAEYRERHPGLAYDEAFALFLKTLRRELGPRGVILTNQGYRAAEHYLPYVDYDITESLITRPVEGRYHLRPRNDPADRWNSIDVIFRELILPVAERYPHVRFVHLNYADAPSPLIQEIVAIARQHGHEAYVALPDVTKTAIDDVYFRR